MTAFWPLLAMVELVALLAAVLICVALGIAGLTVQLRRRRRTDARADAVREAGPISPSPALEQDEERDPFPFQRSPTPTEPPRSRPPRRLTHSDMGI